MERPAQSRGGELPVRIPIKGAFLEGSLSVPEGAFGIVLFVHGSGSSRFSPRNRFVALSLQKAGLATLLFDLLTPTEEQIDAETRHLRFDIGLLEGRLLASTDWIDGEPGLASLRLGYFGASTGAAAALVAAARRPDRVGAVVSRGGRPDLAGPALPLVQAPTQLLVGSEDREVIDLNRRAARKMRAVHSLEIIPGATHLFEEPGALEEVAHRATAWFTRWLGQGGRDEKHV